MALTTEPSLSVASGGLVGLAGMNGPTSFLWTPPSSGSKSVSATLTGSGALSATTARKTSSSLQGQGTLSGVSYARFGVSASLSGTGSLTGKDVPKVAASLPGPGSLSATPVPKLSATLTGSGVVSLSDYAKIPDNGSPTGNGRLTATTSQRFARSPSLAGTGLFAAGTTGLGPFARYARPASTQASGSLSATAVARFSRSVLLSGVGSLPLDPYYSQVVALLHADGSDGSTTFTDSSPMAANWTSVNGAAISTTQSKFGGSSIAFPNTNSYIQPSAALSNYAFGTADFTAEMWLYTISLPVGGATTIMFVSPSIQWLIVNGGAFVWDPDNVQQIVAFAVITTGVWQHIAISRSGGSTRMFVDGVQKGVTYADATNYGCAALTIGKAGAATTHWNGYIDDIRITKGYGWYTSNFTPATSAF